MLPQFFLLLLGDSQGHAHVGARALRFATFAIVRGRLLLCRRWLRPFGRPSRPLDGQQVPRGKGKRWASGIQQQQLGRRQRARNHAHGAGRDRGTGAGPHLRSGEPQSGKLGPIHCTRRARAVHGIPPCSTPPCTRPFPEAVRVLPMMRTGLLNNVYPNQMGRTPVCMHVNVACPKPVCAPLPPSHDDTTTRSGTHPTPPFPTPPVGTRAVPERIVCQQAWKQAHVTSVEADRHA